MRLSYIIFIGFALIILLSSIVSFVNYKLATEVRKNSDFLTNSESIIRNSTRLHKSMIEMQSGFRGYLLTGNDNFLTTYYNGLNEIPPVFIEESGLIITSPLQKERLHNIKQLHDNWVKYANGIIAAKQKMSDTNDISQDYKFLFENQLQKEVGKKINDKIALIFREFDRYEYKIRQVRRDILNKSIKYSQNASVILTIIIMIIGAICAIYITKLISARILNMVHLADLIAKGEFRVIEDNASDELTDLSFSLNIMSATLDKSFTELESKNKELDQFAYVVSHDLKAPLRGLYNILQWIEEDLNHELSSQLKKYLLMMRGRVERLENLISGLLEYARIGRTIQQIENVDVNNLLNDVLEIVPAGFEVDIRKELPVLQAEKIRLEQVFTNLISNAFKYHPKKTGTITIDYEEMDRFYEFSVGDDGAGIAQEYHDRIFVIFQTLRQKNELESTGIGLAIVKKIIDDQKGEIRVESEPGKGSKFIFTWPKEPVKQN